MMKKFKQLFTPKSKQEKKDFSSFFNNASTEEQRVLMEDIARKANQDQRDLVELAGSQGVEVMNWVAMRGALLGDVRELHRNYHLPISNTASGIMLLENRPKLARAA